MPSLKRMLSDKDREKLYDFKHKEIRKENKVVRRRLRKTLDKCRSRVLWLK